MHALEAGSILVPAERRRAARLRTRRAWCSFISGRVLLRQVLGGLLRMPPARVPLAAGERGKPYVPPPWDRGVRFSLSRSGDLVAVAVTLGREIGMDLEQIRPVAHADAIAARCLSLKDALAVARASPDKRDRVFMQRWVAAEALVKGWGLGLGALEAARCADARRDWTVREIAAPHGYVAAIAGEGCDWTVRIPAFGVANLPTSGEARSGDGGKS